MLLYLFTSEGGDREDGNVYYATHLLVDAPEADQPKVDAVLAGLFKASPDLEFRDGADKGADAAFDDLSLVVTHLAGHGITATEITPAYVTRTEY